MSLISEQLPTRQQDAGFAVLPSPHFIDWLAEHRISLGFSTYQTGKLFLVGRKPHHQLSVFERTFNRCMGLCTDGQTLWLATAYQLWRLENAVAPGELDADGFDRQFVPRVGYTTGDVDVHDLAVDSSGRIVFISTLFSCLATIHERYNLMPLWSPKFISRLAPEDRCHLNGLAVENGQPRYVTACSTSDAAEGWRDVRHNGGCVIDIASNAIVTRGLSMPHSPRLYREKLWLLDSGNGNLGYVDRANGKFEAVAFCPGYARGLDFAGDYAIVGLSRPRHEGTFRGLPLDEALASRNQTARCGILVIDLKSGEVVHWLRIEGAVEELYDVIVLSGVVRPAVMGFKTDDIRYNIWIEENGRPTRWSARARET